QGQGSHDILRGRIAHQVSGPIRRFSETSWCGIFNGLAAKFPARTGQGNLPAATEFFLAKWELLARAGNFLPDHFTKCPGAITPESVPETNPCSQTARRLTPRAQATYRLRAVMNTETEVPINSHGRIAAPYASRALVPGPHPRP